VTVPYASTASSNYLGLNVNLIVPDGACRRGRCRRGVAAAPVVNFASVTGQGVRGESEGHALALGNAALMASSGASIEVIREETDRLRRQGRTVIFLCVGDQLAGVIAVGDSIKVTPDSSAARPML
jgi:P-type Cu+ transporter